MFDVFVLSVVVDVFDVVARRRVDNFKVVDYVCVCDMVCKYLLLF